MEIKHVCPLGAECEKAADGYIQRCMWYISLRGKHPQTGAEIDQMSCAIGWLPILLIESTQTNRSTSAAVESLRNEIVKGQTEFNSLISAAVQSRLSNEH